MNSFEGSYDVKITNMKNNGTTLDDYTTTVIADDKIAPQVSGIVFNQNTNKFEITLSEPIDSTTGISASCKWNTSV